MTTSRERWYQTAGLFIRPAMRWWFRLEVTGSSRLPRAGPMILASNHRSNIDPVLVGTALRRPVYYMAKAELFVGPLGWGLKRIGMFEVRRGGIDRDALREAAAVLARGDMLGIFPEGTRGRGDFSEILPGLAYIVVRNSDCPVVPVVLLGTERVREGTGWLPRRLRVRVFVGQALDLPSVKGSHEGRRVASEQLQQGLITFYASVVGAHGSPAAAPEPAGAATVDQTREQ